MGCAWSAQLRTHWRDESPAWCCLVLCICPPPSLSAGSALKYYPPMDPRKRKRDKDADPSQPPGPSSKISGPKPRRMAICTCVFAGCGGKTYIDESGVRCRGQRIPYSTVRGHVQKDESQARLALQQALSPQPPTPNTTDGAASQPAIPQANTPQHATPEPGPPLLPVNSAPHPLQRLFADVEHMDMRGSGV